MATRQYIGARYVPKFYVGSTGNQWDNGVGYEALTIVTYLNNSYTSKKDVPAGVGNPADNTDYWVCTGNYNAQVAECINAVDELGESVEDVVTKVGDLSLLNTEDKDNLVEAINEVYHLALLSVYATPQMYGAVGDGTTDDTTAIQDCIDNNNFVFFPEGTYKTSEITLHSNLKIIGNNAIIKGVYESGSRVFSGDEITNVIIDNMKFRGNGYSSSLSAIMNCFTLHFDDCSNIEITNCELYDTQDRGVIYFSDCHDIRVYNCDIHDYPYSGTIFMTGCHDCWYENNHIYNFGSTAEPNTYGMSMSGYMSGYTNESYNMFVCNNIIETPLCIWEGIDAHGVRDYVVSGNTIKGTKTPIVITSAITPSGYGNARGVIANNIIYGGDDSGTGIQIYNGDCVDIINNIIEHCCKGTGEADGVGIDIRTTKNIKICNNTIKDCGRNDTTNQTGVIYLQGVNGFTVSDNLIINNYVKASGGCAIKFEVSFYNGNIANNKIVNSGSYFIGGTDGFTPTNEITNVKTHNNVCDTYTSYYSNYIEVERVTGVTNLYEGQIGDIVLNIAPSSGNPIGWICTTSRTTSSPAVWTALANL